MLICSNMVRRAVNGVVAVCVCIPLSTTTALGNDNAAGEKTSEANQASPSHVPPFAKDWWKDAAACPNGTTLVGEPPPKGRGIHCEQPDGKMHGRGTSWHPNGGRATEAFFLEGNEHGVKVAWYQNGQMKGRSHVTLGKDDGPFTLWHKNGNKKAECRFKMGLKSGSCIVWHINGKRRSTVQYRAGQKHGRFKLSASGLGGMRTGNAV